MKAEVKSPLHIQKVNMQIPAVINEICTDLLLGNIAVGYLLG